MAFAGDFQKAVDALPPDWTYLELDVRIFDEERYVEAATILVQVNAQGYSRHDWHWRVNVAHRFGHGAAAPATHGTLKNLDDVGIAGELRVREVKQGRAEIVPMWGRPESVRLEFRRSRSH